MQDIYILGSGAMGCLWASYFNNTVPIHFITRASTPSEFDFVKKPTNSIVKTDKIDVQTFNKSNQTIERLIICTKAFDSLNAIQSIQHKLVNDCQVILIQNGMGSQQAIAKQFPHLAIYACSSTEGAYKESENILVHAGSGENHIGPLTSSATEADLSAWLPSSFYQWHTDIEPALWKKLIINAAINPLTVIFNCKNGQLLKDKKAHLTMQSLCAELDELCKALSLDLTPAIVLAESICESTANNFSSMYQDSHHQRHTEIDYITGFIIAQCENLSIPCPVNKSLYVQISS